MKTFGIFFCELAPSAHKRHLQYMSLFVLPGADPFDAALAERLEIESEHPNNGKARTRHLDESGRPKYANRLAFEASPYLRQHAHNPVNWYPWGGEAFAEARRLVRPVFLSIGYATCHWCHVMEEESFEDETIAAFLNHHYVCIKVDREERPDIDAIYMSAVQRLSGHGGWPLSAWLDHNKAPYFGGTYFPPFAGVRGAPHGFLDILGELKRLFDEEPTRVAEAAQSLSLAVIADMAGQPHPRLAAGNVEADPKLLDQAAETYKGLFDEAHAGLRFAPKFPSNLPIRLLLRHANRRGDQESLRMAERTLTAMMLGGLYDHLAGGFHRYATDAAWKVPHFEKMLYDNAQLIVAYIEGYQATGRADFARVVRETCDEMIRTFTAPEGGFYSATDADSEGEEGRYFVWTTSEIKSLLGDGQNVETFLRHYQVTEEGNFEGRTILTVATPDEATTEALAGARAKLLQARTLREPPLRDEKIIAAWNGLAISAFAIAGRVLGRADYVDRAEHAAKFVVEKMRLPAGHLARSVRGDAVGSIGFLDDYAFLTAGLIDLFETTANPRWLKEAMRTGEETEHLFHDPESGGYFMTSDEHERLLGRQRPIFDGAEPSGSAVAFENSARLAVMTEQPSWSARAARDLAFYEPHLRERPMGTSHAFLALDFMAGPVLEAVLASTKSGAGDEIASVFHKNFFPRKVLVHGALQGTPWDEVATLVPWVEGKGAQATQAMAFLCINNRCELPTSDPAMLRKQLQKIAGELGQG